MFRGFLKQNTTPDVVMGPLRDKTDLATEETALGAQVLYWYRYTGGGSGQYTPTTWTHQSQGHYKVNLTTAVTSQLGMVRTALHGAAFLCEPHDWFVLTEQLYDSLFGTDKLQVDAVEISSSTTAADNVEANIANLDQALTDMEDNIRGTDDRDLSDLYDQIVALNDPTAADVADAVLDELLSGHTTAGSLSKAIADLPTAAENADANWDELASEHTVAGTYGKFLDLALSAMEDNIRGSSNRDLTEIYDALAAGDAAAIAIAVWNKAIADHAAAGTFGYVCQQKLTEVAADDVAEAVVNRDLGSGPGQVNTVAEALKAIRGHAKGTRTGSGDVEEVLAPDRAAVLYHRECTPAGGPYTKFTEPGDVIRMPGPGEFVFEGLPPAAVGP